MNSGEGASLLVVDLGRGGVTSNVMLAAGVLLFSKWFFGSPKSSFLAGLPGPRKTSVKWAGDCALPRDSNIGLLRVFSGEKMPSSLRIRRFAGLNRLGPPGESGRLLGLTDLKGLTGGRLGLEGKKRSRGSSCKGPGRRMLGISRKIALWSCCGCGGRSLRGYASKLNQKLPCLCHEDINGKHE
jgi:hypothetical protein